MRTSSIVIAGLALTLSASTVFAGPVQPASHKDHAAAKAAKKPAAAELRCPVTGDKIASIDKAVGHSAYKGKTYYFCCAGCKPQFDKNPEKFLNKKKV